MGALPNWVDEVLHAHKIQVHRYGRIKRGRPRELERRWFFCGWYFHLEKNKKIVAGPYGPYQCRSAAMTTALEYFGLSETSRRLARTRTPVQPGPAYPHRAEHRV